MNPFKSAAILVGYFFGLLILIHFSRFFGLITFCVSLSVLGRLEYEKNAHELSFYCRGELPAAFKTWFRYYGLAEAFVRSAIFGVLPIFLFSGTGAERIFWLAFLFSCCVVIGYFGLRFVQRRARIDVTRWGYVRFSVLLGLLFSVLSSGISGIPLTDVAWQAGKSKWWRALNFDEIAELLYGLMYQVNSFISGTLHTILGDFIGGLLSLLISTNIVYGFIIVLYSLLLLRILSREPQHAKAPIPVRPIA